MTDNSGPRDRAWHALEREGERLRATTLRELFAVDPDRFSRLSIEYDDLLVDFSKEKIDEAALAALLALADAARLEERRDEMFAGARINTTEDRAAFHVALRDGTGQSGGVTIAGEEEVDAGEEVRAVRDRFLAFAEAGRAGAPGAVAATGEPFTDVIHIGIGGSHLGPEMVVRALAPDHDGPRVHFVANVDGADLADTIAPLDPARTLVLVASKTFTTLETMTNANAARAWLMSTVPEDALGAHLVALSTNLEATRAFGVPEERVFGFRDWVGGRYSLWSAIGLPIALAIGAHGFRELLRGAATMDEHFRTAPLARNLPVLMGLISIWRRNILGCASTALIPYDQRLDRFPAHVQQLVMESNGKRVERDTGRPLPRPASPVIWGEPGTNAQHSFFQLLHQGSDTIPVDFILALEPRGADPHHHRLLAANCLAQGAALAFGRTAEEVEEEMRVRGATEEEAARLAPHREVPGDRPSTLVLHRQLDPRSLGRLIALYEHRTFVEGVLWDINSFDQWGVELGKALAGPLAPALAGGPLPEDVDASTAALVARFTRGGN